MPVHALRDAARLLVLFVLLGAPTAAAQEIDDWSERTRSGGAPNACTPRETVRDGGSERLVEQCFGTHDQSVQGETLVLGGNGFARGTQVVITVLGPDGETLARHAETLGADNVPGELPPYDQPELDWRVPPDAPPGRYRARLEWDGRSLEHAFVVHEAPRAFVFGEPPARGAQAILRATGFDEGPLDVTVTQGALTWRGAYRVATLDENGTLALTTIELGIPGAATPSLALDAWATYSSLEIRPRIVADDGAEVVVWMNGTRNGTPASDALSFRVTPGGPRAWVDLRAAPSVAPSPSSPTPRCAPTARATVHVFATGVEGAQEARVVGPNGTLANATGLAAGFVEIPLVLRDVPTGSYSAEIGDRSLAFRLGDPECERFRAPPPQRPTPGPGPAILAGAIALVAIAIGPGRR